MHDVLYDTVHYNVEYSEGSHSYYFKGVHIFIGYIEPLKILQLHILEAQSRPSFLTAKNNYANPP